MLARLAAYLQYLIPKYWLTALIYRLARSRNVAFKNFLITKFVSIYDVDVREIAREVPDDFATFNDFFARELADDVRPIDKNPATIVSPVDGTVSSAGPIEADKIFQAKGRDYSLDDLLATDLHEAQRFRNGSYATLYLAPFNYHRVHAPLAGKLEAAHYVPGTLYSVNAATAAVVPGLFRRNERLALHFSTPAGPYALIFVGALNVGSITTPWSGEIRPRKHGVVDAIDLHGKDCTVAKGDLLGLVQYGQHRDRAIARELRRMARVTARRRHGAHGRGNRHGVRPVSDWRPTSGAEVAKRRATLLTRARRYFEQQDVLCVDTPAVSRYASVDAHIESLSVQSSAGAIGHLQTSPEVYMKRLLAAGYPDIYSICRVFRGQESGRRHLLEFTLAEWYRTGFGLDAITNDTVAFIAACLDLPRLNDTVVVHDYAEIIAAHIGMDPLTAETDALLAVATDDDDLRDSIGTDRNTMLDLIMSTQVVPQFASDCLTVVRHYPVEQAALARRSDDDPRTADRFEVFCGDFELANGYVELTDPGEQAERLGANCDLSLIEALKSGLPDCAGVAVGIERLQMVLDQTDDIRDVVTFASAAS